MTASRGALALLVALAACGAPATAPVPPPMPNPDPIRPVTLDASHSPITYQRIADFPPPGWHVPRLVRVSPDGGLVTYLASESKSDEMALWAFDRQTREHRVLVRARDLVDTDKPMSREEELRRERQRKRIAGVTAYAWADRAPVMLLPLGGDVFVRGAGGEVRRLSSSPEPEIDPKLCADGSWVAFARGRELWALEVASGKEKALTSGAPEGITRGQSDFNGQEEFAEPSGFWWAPSCDRIAYLEVDEREVAEVPILGYRAQVDLQLLRYPRAGEKNPRVRLGIVELASGRTSWAELPEALRGDGYLGRFTWSDDGSALYLQRLSRSQQQLALVRVDARSGKGEVLLEQSHPNWLELGELRAVGADLILTGLADGHRHLWRRDGKSGALVALTQGAWEVFRIVAVDRDAQRVLFLGNRDAVLERQLYAVPIAGGPIVRLSTEPGVHDVEGGPNGWVDIHSANERPPHAVIHGSDGATLGELPVPLDDDFQRLALRSAELVTLKKEGMPDLHGALLRPRQMQPGVRYPAIVVVYGGPGVQTVLDEWNPRLLWQHLADRGFVVFQLDNRGSLGRGHDFQTPIYGRMGEIELDDQLRGAEYLASLPFVDDKRLGIYGHSYGGFMAARAMLAAPGRFHVAVSGSPVTDWRLYDTGYTERYMGTPQSNAEGYARTELAPLAAKLEGKMLIIHALMDENVHFAHTAKLVDALVAAGKRFDLLVYPGERHGYRGTDARRYAYQRVIEYFADNL